MSDEELIECLIDGWYPKYQDFCDEVVIMIRKLQQENATLRERMEKSIAVSKGAIAILEDKLIELSLLENNND